jgi:hypothetical protein
MNTYFVSKHEDSDQTLIVRRDDQGIDWWLALGELDPGYIAWVAEGNTATEWNTNETPSPA